MLDLLKRLQLNEASFACLYISMSLLLKQITLYDLQYVFI